MTNTYREPDYKQLWNSSEADRQRLELELEEERRRKGFKWVRVAEFLGALFFPVFFGGLVISGVTAIALHTQNDIKMDITACRSACTNIARMTRQRGGWSGTECVCSDGKNVATFEDDRVHYKLSRALLAEEE